MNIPNNPPLNFCGQPMVNIPATQGLLKLHNKIVMILSPFPADESYVWELAKRIGLLALLYLSIQHWVFSF